MVCLYSLSLLGVARRICSAAWGQKLNICLGEFRVSGIVRAWWGKGQPVAEYTHKAQKRRPLPHQARKNRKHDNPPKQILILAPRGAEKRRASPSKLRKTENHDTLPKNYQI